MEPIHEAQPELRGDVPRDARWSRGNGYSQSLDHVASIPVFGAAHLDGGAASWQKTNVPSSSDRILAVHAREPPSDEDRCASSSAASTNERTEATDSNDGTTVPARRYESRTVRGRRAITAEGFM